MATEQSSAGLGTVLTVSQAAKHKKRSKDFETNIFLFSGFSKETVGDLLGERCVQPSTFSYSAQSGGEGAPNKKSTEVP